MEFSQIALLLVVAGSFGIISKILKQPLIVGYLFAGFLLSVLGLVKDTSMIESLSKIGVTLLLFLLGLEMNLKELPSICKVALITGLGQIIFTSGIGYLLAISLGFSPLASVYIAVALTFSSTIIMVKLLSEKKDLSSLYGKISIGFLLVQDFVAVLILMFLSGLGGGGNLVYQDYFWIGIKALMLFVVIYLLSRKPLPWLFDKVAGSTELLFIVSIAWALGLASFIQGPLGFSLEIGGFLAGIALSNLPEHVQIAARTRPLRDFFLTLFFLYLGTKLVIGGAFFSVVPAAMIFSVFVLVGNPIIVLLIMGFLGYRKRTSFLAGLTVAQISEFSLILMAMGESLGHLGNAEITSVILVGVITMTISTYLILGADSVYKRIQGFLSIFERSKTKESAYVVEADYKDHVILVGCDRTGKVLANLFKRKGIDFLVVDFNPDLYTKLTADKINTVFGDIADPEILEVIQVEEAKLIISTISNFSDNLLLLEYISKLKSKPKTILTASMRTEAVKLYEAGATFVIVPEIIAGDHIRHLLKAYGVGGKKLVKAGKSHFNRLVYI